jgi:hypothetical protein
MGKGTTTTTPQIPPELSGLYSQTARNIQRGQDVLPLFGGAGVSDGIPAPPAGTPPSGGNTDRFDVPGSGRRPRGRHVI